MNPTNDEVAKHATDKKKNCRTGASKIATLVNQEFDGQLCSTIGWCKCDHYLVVYDPFLDFSLPIPTIPRENKVSFPRQRAPSSLKAQLKYDARSSDIGYGEGRNREDIVIQSEA